MSTRYKLELFSILEDTQMLNTFHFIDNTDTGDAEDLATVFGTDILQALLAPFLSVDINFTLIRTFNLDDTMDSHSLPIDIDGGAAGASMPPYVTATFTMRGSDYTRKGSSVRISGIRESDINGNSIDSSLVTALGAVAVKLVGITDGIGTAEYQGGYFSKKSTDVSPVFVNFTGFNNAIPSTQNTRKKKRSLF